MHTIRNVTLYFFLGVVSAGVSALRADESRIPIFAPTTITTPGTYIVTADVTVPSGTVVTIQSSNVTLDLNRHTLTGGGALSSDLVVVIASGATDVTIRNGLIRGGSKGVSQTSSTGGIRVRIEGVEFSGQPTAIALEGVEFAEIVGCVTNGLPGFASTGAVAVRGSPCFSGRFISNTLNNSNGSGFALTGLNGGIVSGNVIARPASNGIDVRTSDFSNCSSGGGLLISGNVVRNAALFGISLEGVSGALVSGNTVSSSTSYGIRLDNMKGAKVVDNVIDLNGTDGIYVEANSQYDLLDKNQIYGNTGCGIRFLNGTGHAYSNNMLRGNTGGTVCGTANTNAGGNIL